MEGEPNLLTAAEHLNTGITFLAHGRCYHRATNKQITKKPPYFRKAASVAPGGIESLTKPPSIHLKTLTALLFGSNSVQYGGAKPPEYSGFFYVL